MALKILTPAEIWRDFIETTDVIVLSEQVTIRADFVVEHRLCYIAESRDDGEIVVAMRCFVPDTPSAAVLVVEDYDKKYNEEAISSLLSQGYMVAIPDYANRRFEGTAFTAATAYLDVANRGDHLYTINESAADSCQFYYAKMLRRAITLIVKHFGIDKIFVVSSGDSAEIAIMTAAMDSRVAGLALINGFGYGEYNDINVYGDTKEPVFDEQLMCWMTGVASVAYAQYVKCPTLIATGSNSLKCDIDRQSDFIGLMTKSSVSIVRATGVRDTLPNAVYKSCETWLSHVARGIFLPQTPKLELFVNRDGYLYAQIDIDTVAIAEKVDIHYAFSEYDHRFRNWHTAFAASVSNEGNYIASIKNEDVDVPVFAYATVTYLSGVELSSPVVYLEMSDYKVKTNGVASHHIIVNGNSAAKKFVVDRDTDILLREEKQEVISGLGIKGVASINGGLLTFAIGEVSHAMDTELLQVDIYTEKSCDVTIEVEEVSDGATERYSATFHVKGSSLYFSPVRLNVGDFKDAKMVALNSWNNVKSIKIVTPDVAVGNVIFV